MKKTREKGITLIALVVTIIVLLILILICLAMIMGNEGLIRIAINGRERYKESVFQEEEAIDDMADAFPGKKRPKEEELYKAELDGDIKIILKLYGTEINYDTPPNPDESVFAYKEGTVKTGYVIKDKNNGNEFVWVPVKKDQRLSLLVESEQNLTDLKLVDPLNKKINLGLPNKIGTRYENNNITPTANGKYKVTATNKSTTKSVTLVVRSLYAIDTHNDYSDAFGEVSTKCKDVEDYKQGVNSNGGFYIGRYEAGCTKKVRSNYHLNYNITVDELIEESGHPVCKQDQTPYTFLTSDLAKQLSKKMYPDTAKYECSIPTGAAWDRTLGWIIETKDNGLGLSEVMYNSIGWGNYRDAEFNVTRGKFSIEDESNIFVYTAINGTYAKEKNKPVVFTTGAAPNRNVSNNVFDLAGNIIEWTSERTDTNYITRGCSFENYGKQAAVTRSYGGNSMAGMQGFRPVLYLKP